jgi:hypothetical protein
MSKTMEEQADEIRQQTMIPMSMGMLLRIVEEDFEATDQRLGKAALKELVRRCDVLDRLMQKSVALKYNTLGIMFTEHGYLFSIGVMGAPGPAAHTVSTSLFHAIEQVEKELKVEEPNEQDLPGNKDRRA